MHEASCSYNSRLVAATAATDRNVVLTIQGAVSEPISLSIAADMYVNTLSLGNGTEI